MEEKFELDFDIKEKPKKNIYIKMAVLISIIFIILFVIIILIIILKKDSNGEEKNKFKILMKDENIYKPYTLNLTSEIINLNNGLKAILINEKNSTSSSFGVLSFYGCILDVIPGLSHLSEHMAFRGSQKFRDNSFFKGFNYPDIVTDAFTSIDYTYFYCNSIIGNEYETFLDIISDILKNPLLNISVIKNEINVVNSEYLRSNISDDYILNNILSELVNKNHPYYNLLGVGNNITLNSVSTEEMQRYLKGYFQQAYNPNNIILVLYSNKSIHELEKLTMKYFNYEFKVNETLGNKERDKKREKLKSERLYNKEDGGKIIKYYSKIANNLNDTSLYNLLIISFGINNIVYKDGFNPIDFIQYLIYESNDSYLYKYLFDNNYIYIMHPKLWPQFLGAEFGFFHIYIYITEKGINNLEEIIKIFFHYINLIKNNLEDVEKKIFENYKLYKTNKFRYYYDENKNQIDLNKMYILNMKKHGMKNIFKEDVPDKFDKGYFYNFLNDNINIENAIISLNSNYDINKINLFKDHEIKYLNYYGNQYNISNLSSEFIEQLKKDIVDEKYKDLIKLREPNKYFTKISSPSIPCYLKSKEECEIRKEFNPLIEDFYKKYKYNENESDTYLTYYINDRSLNMPKVEIVLKIKTNNILDNSNKNFYKNIYLNPKLESHFSDFLEDSNNFFSISYQDELILTISTYKDIALSIFEKFIDEILNLDSNGEEEFNKLKNLLIFKLYLQTGFSYLNLEDYNPGNILDLFEYGQSDNYPDYGYASINLINNILFNHIQLFFNYYINGFIDYAKLFLIGDLDNDLISSLSQIVKDKIKISNNNANYNFNNEINKNIDNNKISYLNKYINFDIKRKNIYNNVYSKAEHLLNIYKDTTKLNENIYSAKVVNYIYRNNNPYEKESYTGLFYNVKMLNASYNLHFNIFLNLIIEKISYEIRNKRALGYHALALYKSSILKNEYIYFFVQGPMKTPIEIKDIIENIIKEIFNGWNSEDFDSIKKSYMDNVDYLLNVNTFNKRVTNMIINNNENKNKIDWKIIPSNFNEVIEAVKNVFENPIRFGIFEYANYIDSNYIQEEIKYRENEFYFLNSSIKVEYTTDINYLR